MRNETVSLAFGMMGLLGRGSAGLVVADLNAASAASRALLGRRILSFAIGSLLFVH
jgi:hypothetical protein